MTLLGAIPLYFYILTAADRYSKNHRNLSQTPDGIQEATKNGDIDVITSYTTDAPY
jgi:hypothetical protein